MRGMGSITSTFRPFHLPRDVIRTFRSYKPAFSVQIRAGRPCSCSLKKTASLITSIALVHRLISQEAWTPNVAASQNLDEREAEQ